ncbi:MAG: PAC2 family protein, partial [Halobacteriales archaeon]
MRPVGTRRPGPIDYLREQLDRKERGHGDARGLPSITPFKVGIPSYHTRLFSSDEIPLTVLVEELFVPVRAAARFSDAVLDWIKSTDVDEVVILSGVPIQYGSDTHRTVYVAPEGFREHRLADGSVEPMGTGFMDGVNGILVEHGMNTVL